MTLLAKSDGDVHYPCGHHQTFAPDEMLHSYCQKCGPDDLRLDESWDLEDRWHTIAINRDTEGRLLILSGDMWIIPYEDDFSEALSKIQSLLEERWNG